MIGESANETAAGPQFNRQRVIPADEDIFNRERRRFVFPVSRERRLVLAAGEKCEWDFDGSRGRSVHYRQKPGRAAASREGGKLADFTGGQRYGFVPD